MNRKEKRIIRGRIKMERIENLGTEFKPVLTTYIFQFKMQWKKFIFFSVLGVLFVFLLSYLPYALILDNPLPATQAEYLKSGLQFLEFEVIFSSCFFFGGIIVSEFSDKTGHIVYPVINRYKVFFGKFLGSFTMVVGIVAVFYFSLGLLAVSYYGGPINIRFFYSFIIAVLYILAISSIVTFFSSFMRSATMTIVFSIMILFMVFNMVDQLIVMFNPDFEPLYSVNHASNLISYILEQDFPTELADRFNDISFSPPAGMGMGGGGGTFTFRTWLTPTIEMGFTILITYTIIGLSAALYIFKGKQL
jgi:ABC-type transport system involved in multi-copper enzyme maturation permease subunit